MQTLPALHKALEKIERRDIEALKDLALSYEEDGDTEQAELVWGEIFDLEDERNDILLAMQEIKDANF